MRNIKKLIKFCGKYGYHEIIESMSPADFKVEQSLGQHISNFTDTVLDNVLKKSWINAENLSTCIWFAQNFLKIVMQNNPSQTRNIQFHRTIK